MNQPLDAVRGTLADLSNAIDDAFQTAELTDEGEDALAEIAGLAATLARRFDALFTEHEYDEAYERAAARARSNDFADTNGRDWT